MMEKSRGLKALLKEIEDAYADELFTNRELESELFVNQSIDKLSSQDRKFVESFNSSLMQEASIKTILHIKGEYQPRAKKTHSNEEVVRTIEKVEKNYPNYNKNQIISQVAKDLIMTPRAVREHYYKK